MSEEEIYIVCSILSYFTALLAFRVYFGTVGKVDLIIALVAPLTYAALSKLIGE